MNPKTKLRTECDKLFYQICLSRNPNCEICGKLTKQVHHFYPKSCYAHLRFELLNGISLCLVCHFRLTHQDKRLEDKIREKRGEVWFKNLKKMAYNRPQGTFLTLNWYNSQLNRLKKLSYKKNRPFYLGH